MKRYKTDRAGNIVISARVSVCEILGGEWIAKVDGIQHGGTRDTDGSGDLAFPTLGDAIAYAETL